MKMVESVTTEWSNNTTTLGEIAKMKSFPCVVKVCESIGEEDGLSPFSSGDLIKIDSLDVIQKIRGRFVEWVHASGSYEEIVHHDASIPEAYKGFVQVLPKRGSHYVYHSIQDLMTDFPRYVITLDGIPSLKIPKQEVLETIGWNATEGIEPSYALFRNLEKKDIEIPSTTLGCFRVMPDDMEYTLQEVIQRFPLPQIVQFTDQINKELSIEMEDAIVYLKNFERKIMLENVYTESVMLGQYKSVHPDPVTAEFLRAALLIPLSNPDLQHIRVQCPLHRNSGEFGIFVTENFRDIKLVRQFMDKISKFEVTEKQSIGFFEMGPFSRPSQVTASTCTTRRPLPAIPITDADATKEVEKGIKARLKGFLKKPAKSKEKPSATRESKSKSSWVYDITDDVDDDYDYPNFEKLKEAKHKEEKQQMKPILSEMPIASENRSVADNLAQTTKIEADDEHFLKLSDTGVDDDQGHMSSNC